MNRCGEPGKTGSELANRLSKREREVVVATIQFVAALLLYPLEWIALALLLAFRFGPLSALLAPLLGSSRCASSKTSTN